MGFVIHWHESAMELSLYFIFSLRKKVHRHISVGPRPSIWIMSMKKGRYMHCLCMNEEVTPSGQSTKRKQKHLQNRTRSEIFIYLQSHYFWICWCGYLGQIPLSLLVTPKGTVCDLEQEPRKSEAADRRGMQARNGCSDSSLPRPSHLHASFWVKLQQEDRGFDFVEQRNLFFWVESKVGKGGGGQIMDF